MNKVDSIYIICRSLVLGTLFMDLFPPILNSIWLDYNWAICPAVSLSRRELWINKAKATQGRVWFIVSVATDSSVYPVKYCLKLVEKDAV